VGGLLSQDVQSTKKQQSTVRLASSVPSAPSLVAPAARFLTPLHATHRVRHAPRPHKGLLSWWAHDLWGWL
jgi:hypothetical protein